MGCVLWAFLMRHHICSVLEEVALILDDFLSQAQALPSHFSMLPYRYLHEYDILEFWKSDDVCFIFITPLNNDRVT